MISRPLSTMKSQSLPFSGPRFLHLQTGTTTLAWPTPHDHRAEHTRMQVSRCSANLNCCIKAASVPLTPPREGSTSHRASAILRGHQQEQPGASQASLDSEKATTCQVCSWHQSVPEWMTRKPGSQFSSSGAHTPHTIQLINKNLIITAFSKANATEF